MPRLVDAFEQFFDLNGDPLAFGLIDFFESGSDTVRKPTFADSGEEIENSNPVVLNGDGRCPNVFGSGTYRAVLRTSTGSQILQRDPIGGTDELVFGADWSSERSYSISDVVRFNNQYYISQSNNNLNNNPSTDDGSNWVLIILDYPDLVDRQTAKDYDDLRGKDVSRLIDEQVITVTDPGIYGDFIVTNSAAHGLTDNGGTLIVINVDWYATRRYSGPLDARWFGPDGTVGGDSAAVQAAADTGAEYIFLDPIINWNLFNITLNSNVVIFGGTEGTVIFATTKTSSADPIDPYQVSRNIFNADSEGHITFENLILDGSISVFRQAGTVPFTELESPIEITNSNYIVYKNIRFRNTLTQAATDGTRNENGKRGMLYNVGCNNLTIQECEIEDSCYIEGFINYDCTNVIVSKNYTKQERPGFRISSPCVVTGLNTENVLIEGNIWIGYGGSVINALVRRNLKILNNFCNGRGADVSNEASYVLTEPLRDVLIQCNTFDFTDQSPTESGFPNTNVTTGINVSGDTSFKTQNVRVLDNTVISMQRTILIENCELVKVRNNTVINPWGTIFNYGIGIQVIDCDQNINIEDNSVNGASTTEFGVGRRNIYVEGCSDTVDILNNKFFEAEDEHVYLADGNGAVRIETNKFDHDATTPTRNVFSVATGFDTLVQKDNVYKKILGTPNQIDTNTVFSGSKASSFEYLDIVEIPDDEAYQMVIPVDYCFFETSSDNQNYVVIQNKDGGGWGGNIYTSPNVTRTTGALTGTTGSDGDLTVSVASSSVYVENRTGATVYIKVHVR